jgi:formylmethanofuran--tetrahydromethanopterin N-formyltransferase
MRIGSTEIIDTYAEAFGARYTRLVITAAKDHWLDAALGSVAGYGTSVIGCDAEAGVERRLSAEESPDGRPAAAVLLFGFTSETVTQAAQHRVGQCVLTCPSTACFNGLPQAAETYSLGKYLRYFGDGFEEKGTIGGGRRVEGGGRKGEGGGRKAEGKGRKAEGGGAGEGPRQVWRIPVMDGEFVIEATAGLAKGVAGGNIIIQANSQHSALAAAQRAAAAVATSDGVIAPFPGGVCRSGSKVGSKYKGLVASTADAYCPSLRERVESQLAPGVSCAYELVIDGVDQSAVAAAMKAAAQAAAGEGVVAIGAGNYGGRLGKYPIRLHELFA